MSKKTQVGCYYFPNYHEDSRNVERHGAGWSEWDVVRHATPRFPGHDQPKIPLWGYYDEADPENMARNINAASESGIDFFIFDCYYYDDGPFLQRALDEGFLNAPNNDKMKFCCMWANHNWTDIHPCGLGQKPELLYKGTILPETFETVCGLTIEKYFSHPSYFQINGSPYYSFYNLSALINSFGSVKATKVALQDFREKTLAAGFPGIHLNCIVCTAPILPGEEMPTNYPKLIDELGFDSVTSYNWVSYGGWSKTGENNDIYTDFNDMKEHYFRIWEKSAKEFNVPYIPNVTVGWDTSPRTIQSDRWIPNENYPFMPLIGGNTPDAFGQALEDTRVKLSTYDVPQIITVNAWNEWTEGSYIEPDKTNGYGYLDALKAVFTKTNPYFVG